jgi:hypothetical protein
MSLWESDGSGNSEAAGVEVWVDSDKRREFEGIVFDPSDESPEGYYNLWRGFAVEPREGAAANGSSITSPRTFARVTRPSSLG